MSTVYIKEDGSQDYDSVAAWEIAEDGIPLTEDHVAIITGAWTTASGSITIDGWTLNGHTITLRAEDDARHDGKWKATGWRVEVTGSNGIVVLEDVILDGLQVHFTGDADSFNAAYYFNDSSRTTYTNACIARGTLTNSSTACYGFRSRNGTNFFSNCIAYGFHEAGQVNNHGFGDSGAARMTCHNCTAYGCYYGYYTLTSPILEVHNCIGAQCAFNGFDGGWENASHNAADDGTAPGTDSQNGTILFVDAANGDFHLASGDTVCRGNALDLSSDADLPVTTDIDGDTRSAWDIGPDEYSSGGGSALTLDLSDSVTVSDAQAQDVGKALTDTVTAGDALQQAAEKVLSDAVTVSDSATLQLVLLLELADALSVGDAVSHEIGLVRSDALIAGEALELSVGKVLTDAVTVSDDATALVALVLALADAITVSDGYSLAAGKVIVDQATVTDALAHLVAMSLQDSVSAGEAVALSVAKVLADTVGVTDTASLITGIVELLVQINLDRGGPSLTGTLAEFRRTGDVEVTR